MLSEKISEEKTFEDLMQEAMMQIPMYSKEWTNFNPSDPAITTLENLSIYSILQQSYTGQITDIAKEKIFRMLGYEQKGAKNARVLLQPLNVEEPVIIPAGQKFVVGDLCFETNREFKIYGNKFIGIYGKHNENLKDYSVLLDRDIPLEIPVFSSNPEKGMELYMVIGSDRALPDDMNLYVELSEFGHRNHIDKVNLFADIKWQCYTDKGFVDVKYRDNTGNLMTSGEIRLKLPKENMEIYNELPQSGYVIRAVLNKADYDIPPRVKGIYGFLFEVWQKETQSICYTFSQKDKIDVYCDILEQDYIQVFCKEDDGHYYKYELAANSKSKGRFYNKKRYGFGRYGISFNKELYGFGPGNFINAVKLVAYNDIVMRQFDLGQIYGYDNQEIELPIKHIVKDSFSVIIGKCLKNKEFVYDFVKPDCKGENDFKYKLLENEGKIIIEDAAGYINGRLFMCGCSTNKGDDGNIRAGTVFTPYGYDSEIIFINPAQGFGGRKKETLEDMRKRFVADMNDHYTAVTTADYEKIVKNTKGLCIHKVKAIADSKNNRIKIAVKPYGNSEHPVLSSVYLEEIKKNLEERRLLATAVEILQPVYAAVNVQGTLYVKPHFENCMEQIKAVIRRELDYVNSDKNFGDRLNFDRLFQKIEALECVDYIYNLSTTVQNRRYAEQQGMDVIPADNCLLYPGEISIELSTME